MNGNDMGLYILLSRLKEKEKTGPTMKVSELAKLHTRLREIAGGRVPGKWVSAMKLADRIMQVLTDSDAEVEIPATSGDLLDQARELLQNTS